jgi:hypothetical protein
MPVFPVNVDHALPYLVAGVITGYDYFHDKKVAFPYPQITQKTALMNQ